MHQKSSRGFTLTELLAVVVILGVLAAIALPSYRESVEQSRSAEANTNLSLIHMAQKVYAVANGGDYYNLGNNLTSADLAAINSNLNIEITSRYYTITSLTANNAGAVKTFSATATRNNVSGTAGSRVYQIDQTGQVNRIDD